MIPVPGWYYERWKRVQREEMLAARRAIQHKKAVERRRKTKRGGKR